MKKFYSGFKPTRELLNQTTVDLMDRTFYARRAKGLNVQFINAGSGVLDEWSFADAANRDRFIGGLKKAGVEFAISA